MFKIFFWGDISWDIQSEILFYSDARNQNATLLEITCHGSYLFFYRYLNGKKQKASDIEGLEEMMTICSMCNDSSVDYNEVSSLGQNSEDNYS